VDVVIGQRTPMRIRMPLSSPFPGFLDPKALGGKERIPAKSHIFTTRHYRNEQGGDFIDYWVSAEVPPLGYVRSVKKVGTIVSRMELLNIGSGARPEMTQEPRDVDPAEFGRELQRNMRKQQDLETEILPCDAPPNRPMQRISAKRRNTVAAMKGAGPCAAAAGRRSVESP
jgi:hypothetical protein